MNHPNVVCCFCLNIPDSPLINLYSKSGGSTIYFDTITSSLSQLANVISEIGTDCSMCRKCDDTINMIYEFNRTSLINVKIYFNERKKLETEKDETQNILKTLLIEAKNDQHGNVIEQFFIKTDPDFDPLLNVDETETSNASEIVIVKQEIEDISNFAEFSQAVLEEPNIKKENFGEIKTVTLEDNLLTVISDPLNNQEHSPTSSQKQMFVESEHIAESKNEFICICGIVFAEENNFKTHKLTCSMQTENKPHTCDVCGKSFKRRYELTRHETVHTGEKAHVCNICDKSFRTKTSLIRHRLIHKDMELHSCDHCDKQFTDETLLIDHKRVHTEVDIDESLKKHCLPNFDTKGESCSQEVEENYLDSQANDPSSKQGQIQQEFPCGQCNRVFKRERNFYIHLHTHSQPNLMCKVCNKSFKFRGSLSKHMRTQHGSGKALEKHVCEICDKTFLFKYKLTEHMFVHGEKQFFCDSCDAAFTFKRTLVEHLRKHTGEKPYACDICDKAFTTNIQLVYHIKSHIGERSYSCDVCNKSFVHKNILRQHKKLHMSKNFVCYICGLKFRRPSHLTDHIRTHTGERPYLCDVCSRSFSRSSLLIRHKKVVHKN